MVCGVWLTAERVAGVVLNEQRPEGCDSGVSKLSSRSVDRLVDLVGIRFWEASLEVFLYRRKICAKHITRDARFGLLFWRWHR